MTLDKPTPTLTPSCALPTKPTLTDAGIIDLIALAGYAAQHAPCQDAANHVGLVAMKVRTFDRSHR